MNELEKEQQGRTEPMSLLSTDETGVSARSERGNGNAPALADDADEVVLARSFHNPAFFAELVRRYEAPFLRRAERIIHDKEAAQDIVQDTFTKIYLHGRSFRVQEGASFRSWGYRILLTTALSRYRKERRLRDARIDLEPEIAELLTEEGMEDAYEAAQSKDLVNRMLAKLPLSLSRIVELAYWKGLSGEEIAAQEGISHEAVRARMHRAKKKLQEIHNDGDLPTI